MNVEELKNKIEELESELRKKEYQRSQMMGGSTLSKSLDERIQFLRKEIPKLIEEKDDLYWKKISGD